MPGGKVTAGGEERLPFFVFAVIDIILISPLFPRNSDLRMRESNQKKNHTRKQREIKQNEEEKKEDCNLDPINAPLSALKQLQKHPKLSNFKQKEMQTINSNQSEYATSSMMMRGRFLMNEKNCWKGSHIIVWRRAENGGDCEKRYDLKKGMEIDSTERKS